MTSTKPLSHQGTMIEGISVRFEGGQIVEAHATRGEQVLQKMIETLMQMRGGLAKWRWYRNFVADCQPKWAAFPEHAFR